MTATQKKLKMTDTQTEDNVAVSVEGNVMTIQIALDTKGRASGSGKTVVLASTRGNKEVIPGGFLGLNFYKYPEDEKDSKE